MIPEIPTGRSYWIFRHTNWSVSFMFLFVFIN